MGPVAFEPPLRLIPDEQAPEVLQEHRYKEFNPFLASCSSLTTAANIADLGCNK
jgi:hypothetical protein